METEKIYTEQEYNDLKESLLRVSADFANYKRNMEISRNNAISLGKENMVITILDIYDDLQRAVDNGVGKETELIFKKMCNIFEQNNINMYGDVGDEFNDEIHNAISMSDDNNYEKNIITKVFKNGCKINDKIIRYADVIVNS